MRIWGLTGGIASGKSAAARILESEGFPVLDADQVSRELSQPGGLAHASILQRFGTDDRAKLREMIFHDPKARADLEKILHPLIVSESQRRLAAFAKPVAFYEAALLVETGRFRDFDGLLVIEAPIALRRHRLIQRDHLDATLADQILRAQATDEQRRAAANVVIENAGSIEELRRKIRDFIASRRLK